MFYPSELSFFSALKANLWLLSMYTKYKPECHSQLLCTVIVCLCWNAELQHSESLSAELRHWCTRISEMCVPRQNVCVTPALKPAVV